MAFHYFLAQLEISLCAEGQAGEQCKSWQNVLFFCCQFFFFFLTGLLSLFSPVCTHNSVMSFGAVPVSV